jgi:hypothetical protein
MLQDFSEAHKDLQSNASGRGRSSRVTDRHRHSGSRFASPKTLPKAEVQNDVFSESTAQTLDLSAATEFIASAMSSAQGAEKISQRKDIEKLVDLFRGLARYAINLPIP